MNDYDFYKTVTELSITAKINAEQMLGVIGGIVEDGPHYYDTVPSERPSKPYQPRKVWIDLGATKSGSTIMRNDAEKPFDVDQVLVDL